MVIKTVDVLLCPYCGAFVGTQPVRALVLLDDESYVSVPWLMVEEDCIWSHEITEIEISKSLGITCCDEVGLRCHSGSCPYWDEHQIYFSKRYRWSLPHAIASFAFGCSIPTESDFIALNSEQAWQLVKHQGGKDNVR